MSSREKDIVFYIIVALIVFAMLYVGIGTYIDGPPPPAS